MSLLFSVQSFSPIKGGVRPDDPQLAASADTAIRAAEKRAAATAGAIAICATLNMRGEVTGIEVLAVFGDLPDYIIDTLAG